MIGALIEVHRALRPGVLESAYEACFAAQILTYMKLLSVSIGLLVNFNVTSLRQGLYASRSRALHLLIFPIFLSTLPVPLRACTLPLRRFEVLAREKRPSGGRNGHALSEKRPSRQVRVGNSR